MYKYVDRVLGVIGVCIMVGVIVGLVTKLMTPARQVECYKTCKEFCESQP